MIADRNWYADRRGELTAVGAEAAFLVAVKGSEVPHEWRAKVAKFGKAAKPAPAENKVLAPEVELKTTLKAEDGEEIPKRRTAPRKPRKK